jgi:peptide/nickel transport system substrate-binding protein
MRFFSRSLAPALLLVSLAACGGGGAGGGSADDDVPVEQRYGGTAVVGIIGDVPDINPLTSTDHNANQLQQFVLFAPLLRYDERFEPQPWAARAWEVNADTTVLTFHLRDDLYWHDGTRTTAADWKFSYDLARDPNTAFPNSAFWTHYGEAEAVDSFTFRVRMTPHAEFLDAWRSFAAVPRHLLQDVRPADLKNDPFSTTRPVGNGPFRFAARTIGQSWTFEANPDFPADLGGRPYLDRIVLRVVPEPTTLLTELLTGNIDYYIQPTPEQSRRIEQANHLRLISYDDRAFVIIGWNQRRPPFDDVRVRRALTMAIDRQAIIDGVVYGYGDVANSTVPPFFWQYDAETGRGLEHDPEGARRLLAEAGWTPGPDGVLRNAQGQPFRFEMKTNQGNQTRADILQVVQSDLARIGVQMQPRILEWGTLLGQINNPQTRDFDALLIGWVTEFRIDDSDLFHCDKIDEPYQWVGHCDPELDRLLEALPTTVDRDAARPLWQQYQRRVARDQPYTFLYFQERLEGVNNRLRNVNPDARGDWVGARDWYLLPTQRRGSADSAPGVTP